MKPVNFTAFKQQTGLTLIELLLVVAIMTTLSILSAPFFSRFLTQNAVSNTTDQLVNSLRKAQMYSMMGKQNGQWGVHNGTTSFTLFQGSTYATRTTAFDETYTLNGNMSFSGFGSDVIYTKITGIPSTAPTITISGNGISKTISVNAQGTVNRTN